jgi:hypothetical protein
MKVTEYILNGVTVNKTDSELSWRLVHDGTKIISLFESDGITYTTHTIFLATTKEECQTEIYYLNLK